MHVVVLRRETYEANRWAAVSLYKAFCEAKNLIMERFKIASALYTSLPWVIDEAEKTREIMGDDFWSYGINSNRKDLETFFRYHHEQGLSSKLMTIEDIFAPETIDASFVI